MWNFLSPNASRSPTRWRTTCYAMLCVLQRRVGERLAFELRKFQKFLNFCLRSTGWFKANLYTLTGDCDKYVMCTEKIVLGLFSVTMEISFDNNKSEKSNSFIVKKWIGNLNHFFLKIKLTILRLFEANMVSRVPY